MEIKQHGSSDYPFQYYYDNLELFDFHCIQVALAQRILSFYMSRPDKLHAE